MPIMELETMAHQGMVDDKIDLNGRRTLYIVGGLNMWGSSLALSTVTSSDLKEQQSRTTFHLWIRFQVVSEGLCNSNDIQSFFSNRFVKTLQRGFRCFMFDLSHPCVYFSFRNGP